MKQIELTDKTLKRWAQMTDENNHIEVRIEIAKYFALDWKHCGTEGDFVGAYTNARTISDRYNIVDIATRVIVDYAMIARIRKEYGKRVAERVWNCL